MAWSGTVTDRGEDRQDAATATMVSDTFVGSANSVVCCITFADDETTVEASDLSGHDGGGSWVEIMQVLISGKALKLFAAHNDASPSSEAITIASAYRWRVGAMFFEITDVDVSGTVAASFGVNDSNSATGNISSHDLTLASHSTTEGLTLSAHACYASGQTAGADSGYTSQQHSDTGVDMMYAYIGSADISLSLTMTGYAAHAALAIEVVGIDAGYSIVAEAGSVAIAGVDANLEFHRLVDAEAGAWSIASVDANLEFHRLVDAEAGSVAIGGVDASLSAGFAIDAEAGSVAIAGVDANLEFHRLVDAEAGAWSIAGVDAALSVSGDTEIIAEAGAWSIAGVDANLEFHRLVDAEAGSVAIGGVDASLSAGFAIDAEAGSVAIAGIAANLAYSGAVVPVILASDQVIERTHLATLEIQQIISHSGEFT